MAEVPVRQRRPHPRSGGLTARWHWRSPPSRSNWSTRSAGSPAGMHRSTRPGRSFDSIAAGELPPWWEEFTAHGFHAVHLPEQVGGQGGTSGRHGLRRRGRRSGVAARAAAEHRDGKCGRESGRRLGGIADRRSGRRHDRGRRAARALRRPRNGRRGRLAAHRFVGLYAGNLCGPTYPAGRAHREPRRALVRAGRMFTGSGVHDRTAARHRPVHRRRRAAHSPATSSRRRRLCPASPPTRARCVVVALTACAAAGTVRRCAEAATDYIRTSRAVRQAGRHLPGAAAQGGGTAGQHRTGGGRGVGCGARQRRIHRAAPTGRGVGRP